MRKAVHLAFWLILATTAVVAQNSQNSSDPQDLIVLKIKWDRELHYPGRNSRPLQVNEDHERLVRAQKGAIERNDELTSQSQPVIERLPAPMPVPVPGRPSPTYVYRAKVKNNGAKTIKTIFWEYVFIDPNTGQQVGNKKTTSSVKLAPGKSRELIAHFASKPTHVVNIEQSGKKLKDQFTETVIIRRIEYADGSVWERLPEKHESGQSPKDH
jgi:hypothetical protein